MKTRGPLEGTGTEGWCGVQEEKIMTAKELKLILSSYDDSLEVKFCRITWTDANANDYIYDKDFDL
jgi:hypothetical protein